jgi:hypothetical protein
MLFECVLRFFGILGSSSLILRKITSSESSAPPNGLFPALKMRLKKGE